MPLIRTFLLRVFENISPQLLPSTKEEREKIQQLVDDVGVYEDDELTDYVREIGNLLLKTAGLPTKDFSFGILDSEDLNAFVAIDNQIFVNRENYFN